MSDLMLIGMLRMPMDDPSPLDVLQYVGRGRQAADRIEADAAEIAALRDQVFAEQRRALDFRDEAAALRAEVAGMREDAQRYRWLRDVHEHHYTVTRVVGSALIPRLHGPALDAAIDAALAARKGEATTPPPSPSPRS